MRNLTTLVLVAVLCLQLPVGAQPAAANMGEFVRGLAPGTYVKLRLSNGAKVRGMLVTSESDAVNVKPRTRIPEPIRRVRLDEIVDADIVRGSSGPRTIALAAAVGAGATLGFLFILAAAYGSD